MNNDLPRLLTWLSIPEAIIGAIVLIAVTDLETAIVVAIAVGYVAVMFAFGRWLRGINEAKRREQELEASGLNPDEVPETFKNL